MSDFDDALPPVSSDGGSTPHPDPPQRSAPGGFEQGLPPTKDTTSQPPLMGTSWQTIVGNPQIYGSIAPPGMESVTPETASGILHGIREGVIDKPAEWLAGWFGGKDTRTSVEQGNKADADAARAAAQGDPGGFSAGNIAGRVAGQTAVLGPVLRGAGAVASMVPGVGRVVGPLIAGTAGEGTPGLPGIVARTAAGGTSGALAGGASAGLSGTDPIRGMVEGGLFGTGISAGAQALERALQTVTGSYVPPDVRTSTGGWQASDETVQRARQAQLLSNEGVPVMVRQVTQDPALKPVDAPWSLQGGDLGNQQQAFRRASLAKATGQGDGSTSGAPSLVTDQFAKDQTARLQGNFQTVAKNNNIDFGANLAPQLTALGTELNGVDKATQDAIAPYLRTVMQSVSKDPVTGAPIITGSKYLDLTNSNSTLQTLAAGGGVNGQYAQRIINLLHDGLSASASPADQALLKATRDQWRALQTLKAAAGPDGSFEPQDLLTQTDATAKRFGGSQGTLDGLAKAGATVLQPSYPGGGIKAGAGGVASSSVPSAVALGASHMVPGLLGGIGAMAGPAAGTAFAVPLLAQAFNRNPEAVMRAIRTLQGGANFAPYRIGPAVGPVGVVASQQPGG